MPDHPLPEEVRQRLADRAAAREARDWARADVLRDELAAMGWEVQDGAGGSRVRPILPPASEELPHERLEEPAQVDLSIQVVAEDHPDDLARFLAGLAAHPPAASWELLVVANAPSYDVDRYIGEADLPMAPEVLRVADRLGWADSRTLGMTRSRGAVTLLLDTSLEPVGDFATPILAAFQDPQIGIAGGWGVTSANARQFEDAPPGDVDAIEAYCLAIRREALRQVPGFDRRYRFYRNADLDFSFAVRDAGWRALRTGPLPLERHEHRGWTSLPDAERDRQSKRNFYRFLDRWGSRQDLLLDPDR